MRIRSPARPRSSLEFVEFNIGVENLEDANGSAIYIPTITMHIAPQNLDMQYRKVINRFRTRGGWVEQHWGDELDTMNATASTGSFFVLNQGLTVAQRHQSLSMINFQEIFSLYQNNACAYDLNGNIISQGDVFIEYDSFKLFGQFQSFHWTEDATVPYRWNFNFGFEVTRSTQLL